MDILKMRYVIYILSFVILSFAKNTGKILSNKYGQKLVDSAKKSATDVLKIASKKAIQKTVEATWDLVVNKVAEKITSISKKPASEPHSNVVSNEVPKERNISPQERQQIIDQLPLM